MKFRRTAMCLIAACSPLGFAANALAQQTPKTGGASQDESQASGKLEEIVVTARRTNERLVDVPVAVTALSAEAIQRAHVSDLTQIAQMTPNLIVASAVSGTGGSIAIRGIATSFLDPGVEQSVGLKSTAWRSAARTT